MDYQNSLNFKIYTRIIYFNDAQLGSTLQQAQASQRCRFGHGCQTHMLHLASIFSSEVFGRDIYYYQSIPKRINLPQNFLNLYFISSQFKCDSGIINFGSSNKMNLYKRLCFQLFIQAHKTPNPNFLKFVPTAKIVMGAEDPIDIKTAEQAYKISPLARRLFKIEGVTQVFYGKDYISISKKEEVNWNDIKPLIFDLIQSHYESNDPLIVDKSGLNESGILETDSQIVREIKDLLTSRVRPFVQDDGGDVQFISFDESTGVLTLKMLGSCSGCPSTNATLKNGILKMMKYYIGQIKDVVSDQEKKK